MPDKFSRQKPSAFYKKCLSPVAHFLLLRNLERQNDLNFRKFDIRCLCLMGNALEHCLSKVQGIASCTRSVREMMETVQPSLPPFARAAKQFYCKVEMQCWSSDGRKTSARSIQALEPTNRGLSGSFVLQRGWELHLKLAKAQAGYETWMPLGKRAP